MQECRHELKSGGRGLVLRGHLAREARVKF